MRSALTTQERPATESRRTLQAGFFSQEWVAWSKIYAACNVPDPITSVLFRGLFRGKRVNTASFLLGVFQDSCTLNERQSHAVQAHQIDADSI